MFYRKIIIATTDTPSHLMNKTDSNYYQKHAEKENCVVTIVAENKSTTMKPLEFNFLALTFILSN
jgi:hypothetical protein